MLLYVEKMEGGLFSFLLVFLFILFPRNEMRRRCRAMEYLHENTHTHIYIDR